MSPFLEAGAVFDVGHLAADGAAGMALLETMRETPQPAAEPAQRAFHRIASTTSRSLLGSPWQTKRRRRTKLPRGATQRTSPGSIASS